MLPTSITFREAQVKARDNPKIVLYGGSVCSRQGKSLGENGETPSRRINAGGPICTVRIEDKKDKRVPRDQRELERRNDRRDIISSL
ncbi:hypothetical protein HPB47_014747 [Ixodes persulcatus]|uniref:Uncharacterized protein n=1 Tax=Ixodes persulcatus TaxID=34615 RepID=A0AC60QWK7_IXOPE|nr:hypothetical protein HPB47_014747 [Ixodes persulcatus]